MALFFIGMLQKLRGHTFSVDPGRHKVMAFVAQDANNLGRQRFVEQLYDSLTVGLVSFGYRAIFDVLACPFAESFDVGQKRFISHSVLLDYSDIGNGSILLARTNGSKGG